MANLQQVVNDHDAATQADIDAFHRRMSVILRKAQIALLFWLTSRLVVADNGRVKSTLSNLRVLSGIPDKFIALLNDAGVKSIIAEFSADLEKQDEFFSKTVKAAGYEKAISFDAASERYFEAFRKSKVDDLLREALLSAERAAIHGEMGVGGLLSDLTASVGEQLGVTVARLRTVASTAISMYYRAVAEEGYAKIEKETPLRYFYAGPPSGDPKIRPFCKALMAAVEHGRTWTRAEIDAMDNGQLPNTFVTCGGYGCRHQFVMAAGFLKVGAA